MRFFWLVASPVFVHGDTNFHAYWAHVHDAVINDWLGVLTILLV